MTDSSSVKGQFLSSSLPPVMPGRHQKGAGLDAVGHDGIFRPAQAADALDADGAAAVAFDLRAAGDKEVGQIHHFGLAGRVFQRGLAVGQHGGHEQVFRAAHGGHVKGDVGAAQLVAMAHDVAFFQLEGGAHELQALQVLVHGAGADGAAAGQGHAGLADTGQQRTQAEHRGAHGAHQIIRSLGSRLPGFSSTR